MIPITLKDIEKEERRYRKRLVVGYELVVLLCQLLLLLTAFLGKASLGDLIFEGFVAALMLGLTWKQVATEEESRLESLHVAFLLGLMIFVVHGTAPQPGALALAAGAIATVFQTHALKKALFLLAQLSSLGLVLMLLLPAPLGPGWWESGGATELLVYGFLTAGLSSAMALGTLRHHRTRRDMMALGLTYPYSGLPRRQLMQEAFEHKKSGFVVLLQCHNYSDLVLVSNTGTGPQLIQRLGQHLSEFGRSQGVEVFQLRDNEYALFLSPPGFTSRFAVEEVLLTLHRELEALPLGSALEKPQVAMGVVEILQKTKARALGLADQALRTALKQHAPLEFFSGSDQSLALTKRRFGRLTALTKHLEQGTLEVHFQAVINSQTMELAFFEALIRVPDDSGGLVSVFPYLEAAENAGILPQLALVVIERAAAFASERSVSVSINLSTQDILSSAVTQALLAQGRRLKPGTLILEFLERSDLLEIPSLGAYLAQMRSAGHRLALDDFGSGFSSFLTLINLPVDLVKIDGALVKRCLEDSKAQLLVESLIRSCQQIGLEVVGEHIDSVELFTWLKALGVEYLQGYLLSRPQPQSALDSVGPSAESALLPSVAS